MRELLVLLIAILMACAAVLVYGRAVGVPSGEDIVTVTEYLQIVLVFLLPAAAGYLIGRIG